jgi:oligopeptidase B
MTSRTRVLRKRQEIPSGHNPADYVTTRIMAPSDERAEVPVSILHRGSPRDGSAPLLLYGYGSTAWRCRVVFRQPAVAGRSRFCLRHRAYQGGSDKGWGWYLDGKRDKKTNSFDDFAASARAHRCQIHGSKAHRQPWRQRRRMLMGAAANRAGSCSPASSPEVPFVDVLNTMLDDLCR